MRNLPLFNLSVPNASDVSDPTFKVYAQESELLITEEIGQDFFGEGLAPKDVVGFLNANPGNIHVRLNSPGGYVYDGMQIYNALAQHKGTVTVTVEGLAHSAASLVAMAGDVIRMHEASDLGIHRAWAGAIGNSKTMRGLAEWLEKIDSHLATVYSARSGQPKEQIEQWLDGTDDGTIFTADEAVAAGFADEVIEIVGKAAAKRDLKRHHAMIQARLKAKHASYRHNRS
jgi:ATP-dependent Clp protease protease subunit